MTEIPSPEVVTRTEKYQREVNYFDRWQRRFLYMGAFYDGFFGVTLYFWAKWSTEFFHLVIPQTGTKQEWPIVWWPQWLEDSLHLTSPANQLWGDEAKWIWVQMVGILLIVLSMLYTLAARNPSRLMGIVLVCIIGKAWSVGYYLYYCFGLHAPIAYISFAVLDFVFFFLHIWALGPDRKNRVMDCLKKANLRP